MVRLKRFGSSALVTAARRHWRWYLPGCLFLPLMVIGREAAWAGLSVPRADWVLPLFAFMPGIADVPRWRGQSRFEDTLVWGMLAPLVTGAVVSLCRVGIRALVGWPE